MITDRTNPAGRIAAHHRSGTGIARVPYPIGVRRVAVTARRQLTPRMLRLTLAGPGLAGLHTYQADDHVKLVFPDADGTRRDPVPNDQGLLDWPRPMPVTRKYTIRRYDPDALELDLDVVLHDGGVASAWASSCAVGDEVTVAGPPGAKAFPHTYDHYVFAVDTTALPAVGRWLAESAPDVSADLVVVTDDPAEHAYPLTARDRVSVRWLTRDGASAVLRSAVESLTLPAGRVFLFAAGEAGEIKPLRQWARGRTDALITGYWKRGVAGLEDD